MRPYSRSISARTRSAPASARPKSGWDIVGSPGEAVGGRGSETSAVGSAADRTVVRGVKIGERRIGTKWVRWSDGPIFAALEGENRVGISGIQDSRNCVSISGIQDSRNSGICIEFRSEMRVLQHVASLF